MTAILQRKSADETTRRKATIRPGSSAEAEMLKKYSPAVRRIANSLQRLRPAFLDRDDVFQDGMLGLLRALRSNHNDGNDGEERRFQAYVGTCVRGAIIDSYRNTSGISRLDYRRARQTRQALAHGFAVTPAEKDMADRIMIAAWAPTESVDGEDGVSLATPYPGPEQRAMCNDLLRLTIDALQQVPVRERTIFIACEIHGDKQADLAASFKISVARVSQIIKEVRRRVTCALGQAHGASRRSS